MPKAYKIAEVDGKKISTKEKAELPSGLKGRVVILKPEESEVAKNLEIKEKGTYAIKTL